MNSLLRLRLQVEVKGMEQFAAVKGALAQMQKQVNAASRNRAAPAAAVAGGGAAVAASKQVMSANRLLAINRNLAGLSASAVNSKKAEVAATTKLVGINRNLANLERSRASSAKSAASAAARGSGGGGAVMNQGLAAASSGWASFTAKIKAMMTKSDPDKFFHSWNRSLIGMGKQVQWTGRQLEYNFTLPIVRAGKAILEMGKKNEEALTRVVKVYGTGTESVEGFSTKMLVAGQNMDKVERGSMTAMELTAYDMGRAFRSLSDIFGISLDQVSELGAKWAAAGATGANLAKSVRLTMEAMLVGDFTDTEEAFNTLIQVQSAYGLETQQMTAAMAVLNQVENVSAASFTDLSKVVARAGASAKTAGVDLTELASIAAALVPATGSAETAGNSLKTLFSRLLVPTADAAELMGKMGINTEDVGWISQTATERLKTMGTAFADLTNPQQAVVSAFVAGRYQLNRFETLMADIVNPVGNFGKSMDALSGDLTENGQVMKQYRKELVTLLSSNPKQMEILKTRIRNVANEVVVHLYPTIIMVLKAISDLARKFSELTPAQKQMIVMALGFLAVIGPVMRVAGAVMQLGGVIFKVFAGIGKAVFFGVVYFFKFLGIVWKVFGGVKSAFSWLLRLVWAGVAGLASALGLPIWAVLAIITLVLAAVLLVIYSFTDKAKSPFSGLVESIKSFFRPLGKFISQVFNSLPGPIKNAMMAVLNIIKAAAKAIYKALSYLNPFAKHSPSLVEQVIKGVDLIAAKYASLRHIGHVFRQATADLQAFKDATADALLAQGQGERNEQRADVALLAPQALPQFDALVGSYDALKSAAADVKYEMDNQQAVVNDLQRAYDDLGRQIGTAERVLRGLETTANALKEELEAAQSAIAGYADAPLVGMGAMEDAIFANTMAQKKLQLEMMNIEDAVGPIDQVADRLALLAGEIEQLQGLQEDLRRAGAGSEITGPIQDQIDALESQRAAIADQTAPLEGMQDELDALGRAATRLDLENSLQFDPLNRQIDQLTSTMKELPFDQVIAGITAEQAKLIPLTAAYDQASAAVRDQKLHVDSLNAAREAMDANLDIEKQKLEELQTTYRAMEELLREIEEAFGALSAAASDARAAMEEGGAQGGAADQFDAAGAGDFDDGGIGAVTDFGDDAGLEELANSFAEEADKAFAGLNPFAKLKEKWTEFKTWWRTNVTGALATLWADMTGGDGVGLGEKWESLKTSFGFLKGVFEGLGNAWEGFIGIVEKYGVPIGITLWESFVDLFTSVKDAVVDAAKAFWEKISPALENMKTLIEPAKEALGHLGVAFGVLLGILLLALAGLMKLAGWLIEVLSPAFSAVFSTIGSTLNGFLDIFTSVVGLILAIINGDWKEAWQNLVGIFIGIWDTMFSIVTAAWHILWGLFVGGIKRILQSVISLFKTIWSWINPFDGHSPSIVDRVRDGIAAIVGFFLELPGKILQFIIDFGLSLLGAFINMMTGAATAVGDGIIAIVDFFIGLPQRIWDTLLTVLTWLWQTGWDLLTGLFNGIIEFLPTLIAWWVGLPLAIIGWIADVTTTLAQKGKDFVQGLLDGIVDLAKDVWKWWENLSVTIVNKVGEVARSLWQKGKDFVQGLINGIEEIAGNVWSFFTGLATALPEKVGNVTRVLWDKGKDIIWSIIYGIYEVERTLFNFFTALPQKILDSIVGAGTLLFDVGKAIIQGLIDGFNFMKGAVSGALGAITDLIPIKKGPPVKDAQLLRNNGQLIMQGLIAGLQDEVPQLRNELEGITDMVALGSMNIAMAAQVEAPRNDQGPKTLVFNGDLVLPNISSPEDADLFIKNLEVLATR